MKVAIIGAGAVGRALGSCLIAGDHRCHFATRTRESADQLRSTGFRRTGLFGEVDAAPDRFTTSDEIESLCDEAWDAILLCTKTTATTAVGARLAKVWPRLTSRPKLVVCQNGWGSSEQICEWLPESDVFNARIITGFRRTDAGVDVTVHVSSILIGSLFGFDSAQLAPLCEAIESGGVPCELSDDIAGELWAKLLYNALLNPLGALLRVPYGELGRRETTREVMACIAKEIFAVLQAAGIRTRWQSADAYLSDFYTELLPPTAGHESSMLQDVRAGRSTEIQSLCGAVARLGHSVSVGTPVNEALCELVEASSSG
jgi:2-dehydropantoate 2-reductase